VGLLSDNIRMVSGGMDWLLGVFSGSVSRFPNKHGVT
jgi:hypothetical protein